MFMNMMGLLVSLQIDINVNIHNVTQAKTYLHIYKSIVNCTVE